MCDDDGAYVLDRMVNYSYSQDFNSSDDEHVGGKVVDTVVGLGIDLDRYGNVGYDAFDYD